MSNEKKLRNRSVKHGSKRRGRHLQSSLPAWLPACGDGGPGTAIAICLAMPVAASGATFVRHAFPHSCPSHCKTVGLRPDQHGPECELPEEVAPRPCRSSWRSVFPVRPVCARAVSSAVLQPRCSCPVLSLHEIELRELKAACLPAGYGAMRR